MSDSNRIVVQWCSDTEEAGSAQLHDKLHFGYIIRDVVNVASGVYEFHLSKLGGEARDFKAHDVPEKTEW